MPSAAREPKSQRQLALQLEVHEVTLSEWKRLPGWHDAVYALGAAHLVAELVPVLHAQIAEAKKGSLPHAQWLFEIAGKWSPKLPATGVTINVVTEIETILPPPKIETISEHDVEIIE